MYTSAVAMTMTVSEARAALPQILDRVAEGEEVTITRHGVPVAVVRRPGGRNHQRAAEVYAEAERLRARMEEAGKRPLSELKGLEPGRAEELVAQIRADRDAE